MSDHVYLDCPDYDHAESVPLPECGEWTRGETCDDSLCPAHGAEVQANLRATAALSWVGVIALAREIVRTQDVAERYGRGEIRELPIEPMEPGDLSYCLSRLWGRGCAQYGPTGLRPLPWSDFAEGLLSGLGYDLGGSVCYECGARATCGHPDEQGGYCCDGCCDHGASGEECTPIADLDHGGTPEQAGAWRAGRMWAEAWGAAEQAPVDDPSRWKPDPGRLPWEQPVCRDSAWRCRCHRESASAYQFARAWRNLASPSRARKYQREAARLSKLARPWEPSGDVVSDDGRVFLALHPVEDYA